MSKNKKQTSAETPEIVRRDIINSAIQIRKKRVQARQIWGNIVFRLLFFCLIVWAVFTFLLGVKTIQTNDMYPAVRAGDMVIYIRLISYKNSDIVLYDNRIGRIQGTEGMEVKKNGENKIIIDGNLQPPQDRVGLYYETYVSDRDAIEYPSVIPQGEYLILGDQREKATDSRKLGYVPKEKLKGKVFIVIKRRAL